VVTLAGRKHYRDLAASQLEVEAAVGVEITEISVSHQLEQEKSMTAGPLRVGSVSKVPLSAEDTGFYLDADLHFRFRKKKNP